MPAPKRNDNAGSSGLYAKNPTHKVTVMANVTTPELATYAEDMGTAALALAQTIEEAMQNEQHRGRIALAKEGPKLIGLYASVAQELFQVAAELAGEVGIKAASLGKLSDGQFELLMMREAQALSLILSQCRTAWVRMSDKEVIAGKGLADEDGVNAVLSYLAGHMRSAKRIMREMAANLAWKERGVEKGGDLAARLMNVIEEELGHGKSD